MQNSSNFPILFYFHKWDIENLLKLLISDQNQNQDQELSRLINKIEVIIRQPDYFPGNIDDFTRAELKICRRVLSSKDQDLKDKLYFDYVPLSRFMRQCGAYSDAEKDRVKNALISQEVKIYEEKAEVFNVSLDLSKQKKTSDLVFHNYFLKQDYVNELSIEIFEVFHCWLASDAKLREKSHFQLLDFIDAALFFLFGYCDTHITQACLNMQDNLIWLSDLERWRERLPISVMNDFRHYIDVFRNAIRGSVQNNSSPKHLWGIEEYHKLLEKNKMYIHPRIKKIFLKDISYNDETSKERVDRITKRMQEIMIYEHNQGKEISLKKDIAKQIFSEDSFHYSTGHQPVIGTYLKDLEGYTNTKANILKQSK